MKDHLHLMEKRRLHIKGENGRAKMKWKPSSAQTTAYWWEKEERIRETVGAQECCTTGLGDLFHEHKPTLHLVLMIRGLDTRYRWNTLGG